MLCHQMLWCRRIWTRHLGRKCRSSRRFEHYLLALCIGMRLTCFDPDCCIERSHPCGVLSQVPYAGVKQFYQTCFDRIAEALFSPVFGRIRQQLCCLNTSIHVSYIFIVILHNSIAAFCLLLKQ